MSNARMRAPMTNDRARKKCFLNERMISCSFLKIFFAPGIKLGCSTWVLSIQPGVLSTLWFQQWALAIRAGPVNRVNSFAWINEDQVRIALPAKQHGAGLRQRDVTGARPVSLLNRVLSKKCSREMSLDCTRRLGSNDENRFAILAD